MTIDGAMKWTWNDHEMIMKHCEDELWDVIERYLCPSGQKVDII